MPLSPNDKSTIKALADTVDNVIDACLALRKELEQAREASPDSLTRDNIDIDIIDVDRMRFKWQREARRLVNVNSPGHLQFMIQRLELEQSVASR